MKNGRKEKMKTPKVRTPSVLGILVVLLAVVLGSCSTLGYPLAAEEQSIGTVETSFIVPGAYTRDTLLAQAYTELLEAAGKTYSGTVDVRDVRFGWVWKQVTDDKRSDYGQSHATNEIKASAKVIRLR